MAMTLPRSIGWRALPIVALTATLLWRGEPILAAELGLVFYTPQQRLALEKQLAESRQDSQAVAPNGEPIASAGPRMIHFNGLVRRSDGPAAAWLDGRLLGPDSVPANVRARLIGERLELTSPDSRRVLRPGDRETLVSVPPSSEPRQP